ncbi:MAG: phosphatase PAP2 family protein [Hyphomicrobiaceae bacterium]|nr:phosphatase PAP2 family protein [Hyphomicrobiaceae bacterium]
MKDQPLRTSWLVASRNVERALIAFAAASLAVMLVSALLSVLLRQHPLAFDAWLLRAFRTSADLAVPVGSRALQIAIRDITALGGVLVLALLVAIVAVFLMLKRHWHTAVAVVASAALGVLASQLLKALVGRSRPDVVPQLVPELSGSFPSGHAMMSVIVYLTLGTMLARLEDDRAVRRFLIGTAIAITIAVGMSRIYLGVHWPSDVLGGWSLGALWVLGVSRLLDAAATRRASR